MCKKEAYHVNKVMQFSKIHLLYQNGHTGYMLSFFHDGKSKARKLVFISCFYKNKFRNLASIMYMYTTTVYFRYLLETWTWCPLSMFFKVLSQNLIGAIDLLKTKYRSSAITQCSHAYLQ